MACSGDSTTLCGGPNRLNLYKYTGTNLPAAPTVLASYNNWYSKGCYTDSVVNRALTVQSFKDSMTVEMCIDACANAGHIVAGLEFGTECYCGDALPTTPATDNCIMPCGGDSSHICGGPNRLNVYQKRLEDPWAPWQWSGCKESLAKSIMSPKDLSHTTTMTIQQCTSYCEAQNMVVAMITANMDCQCGSLASVDEGDATCNKPCSGDPTQFCGVDGQTTSDSELITVAASVYVKPTTQPVLALPSGQGVTTYKGCYAPTGMAFVPVAHAGDIWTHEFCSDMCKGEGMPISALSTTGTFQGSPYLLAVIIFPQIPWTPANAINPAQRTQPRNVEVQMLTLSLSAFRILPVIMRNNLGLHGHVVNILIFAV
ncbi:hypothetical protein FS842_002072 [Serendipita sp. 407]|nr:hypothetical protein FS842_002072 [Serendipita sp. 407]